MRAERVASRALQRHGNTEVEHLGRHQTGRRRLGLQDRLSLLEFALLDLDHGNGVSEKHPDTRMWGGTKPLFQMSERAVSLAAMHQHSADMVGSPFVLGLGMSRWEQFLRLRELTPGDIKGRERVLSAAMLGVQRYDLAIRRKCFTNAIQLFQGVRSRQMPRDIVGE